MKVAIVHYWLVGMRGGEKVIEEICELFPEADIYTLVVDSGKISEKLRKHNIYTSFLQRIGGRKHYQKMLPLMPFALEAFDLTSYDLVISSEAGPAKAVVTHPDAVHICYCHSPMRYIWDLEPQYRKEAGVLARAMLRLCGPMLRQWDVTTANRVDHFIANSKYVAKRIRKIYRREADVINPPVNVGRFARSETVDDVYICAGQITPYKRIDVAIDAFNKLGKRLDVIGAGATDKLKKGAGPTIRFFDALSDAEMADRFSRCKALIYPGIEDFGIVPLEVMGSGRPVIAFGRGGATETVRDGVTGLLFGEQTSDALAAAVVQFEANIEQFTSENCIAHASQFSAAKFRERFASFVDRALEQTP